MSEKPLPPGFTFGIATSGFQIEGGYNGPGEPANNWAAWEAAGRVEPSGIALDFWNRFEEQVPLARATGADSLRLSVEWTRCEPGEGQLDDDAFARYESILNCCRESGLEPLVTLHHFTHPAWLGEDFWLERSSPERFARWVDEAVGRLGSLCRKWVTLNEINVLPEQSYLTGSYPPGHRGDTRSAVRAMDNLLTAHVLAYETIHRHRPDAVVTTNNSSSSVYEFDRILHDLLLARSFGVDQPELGHWLRHKRADFYAKTRRGRRPGLAERVLRKLLARVIPMEQAFPRAVSAVYASQHQRLIDVVGFDYYDPAASHALQVPGHRSAGGRCWRPARETWDVQADPSGLVAYSMAIQDGGVGVWVAENGIANRVVRGRAYQRLDSWDRVRFLRENLEAVEAAIDSGVPLTGYWHWTLADNYEWGSYEPRFGLYGVDRERGGRWSHLDSMGRDAAGAYRRIIEEMRAR